MIHSCKDAAAQLADRRVNLGMDGAEGLAGGQREQDAWCRRYAVAHNEIVPTVGLIKGDEELEDL